MVSNAAAKKKKIKKARGIQDIMCLHLSKQVSWRHGGSTLLSCHFCLKLLPHAIRRSVTDLLSDRTELICYFCTQTFFIFLKEYLTNPEKAAFYPTGAVQGYYIPWHGAQCAWAAYSFGKICTEYF